MSVLSEPSGAFLKNSGFQEKPGTNTSFIFTPMVRAVLEERVYKDQPGVNLVAADPEGFGPREKLRSRSGKVFYGKEKLNPTGRSLVPVCFCFCRLLLLRLKTAARLERA